ncbi:MAG: PDZ domain-containing protein [Bdellovibrionota bacterium]
MKLLLSALLFCLPLSSFAATTQIVGVGIMLQEDNHKIMVKGLVPNAPAAREGQIHEGDQIVAVQQFEGDELGWLPLDQFKIDEVVQLVRGDAGTKVGLHLGGEHGQYEVFLSREAFDVP